MTRRNTSQQPTTQRNIFLNLSLFQFLCFVRRGVFYTFMINYLYNLVGESATLTTLLGTFNMIGSSLGQNLLWGKISDRYKLRAKLILIGESIAAIAYFIVFQIHKSLIDMQADFSAGLSLIIGLSVLEFFWSMSDVGWAALLTDTTTTKTRGAVVGALNSIAALGRMIGIIFAGFLYNNGNGFSSGTIFYIVIGMLAVSATIMWITSRSTQKTTVKTEELVIKDAPETNAVSDNGKLYKWFLISLIVIIIGTACVSQIFLLFLPLAEGLAASAPEMSLILTAWTLGGMLTCVFCGRLADRFGRIKILFVGFILATLTPIFYGLAPNVLTMAFIYGLNGVAFWTIQTVGFAFAGDIIAEDRRGRLLSRYNMVIALSWGPAGLLIGGPLADLQTDRLGLSAHTAFINAFYVSAIIVAIGTLLFAVKVAGSKQKTN
jgi:MFS family permease